MGFQFRFARHFKQVRDSSPTLWGTKFAFCRLREKIMTYIKRTLVLFGLVILCVSAFAQEDKEASTFTYATYFYCDVAGQEQADEIFKKNSAAVLDQMIEDALGEDPTASVENCWTRDEGGRDCCRDPGSGHRGRH